MTLKKSLLLLFQLWLVCPCLLAQLRPEWQAPGTYRKTDFYSLSLQGNDRAMSMKMLDAMVDVVKKIYPNPTGAVIGPYGGNFKNYRGDAEFKGGPYVYDLVIPFFEFTKSRNGGLEPGDEYGSAINIWMNSARFILQGNSVKWGNDRVFRQPVPGIPVGGFPKYNNMILILPPGKSVPWRPATKQEYLENYIEALSASFAGRSVTDYERQQVPAARQYLASLSPSERNQVACLRKWKYSNDKVGYPDFVTDKWAGFLNPADTTGEPLVIVDESFYEKNIPRTTFQLIVIDREYKRSTISAAAPTPDAIKYSKMINDRLNNIVRTKELLTGFQQLLGKPGWDYVASNKKVAPPAQKFVLKRAVVKNLDHIVDSLMRYYKDDLPGATTGIAKGPKPPDAQEITLPSPNSRKLAFAARRLNSKEEVVKYVDELDKRISSVYAGTTVPAFNSSNEAAKASYGYWLFIKPREALLAAVQAAKKDPDNDAALNNLGTQLSLCGADFAAVPLYIVCLKKEPNNSTITNNLGQSYLALGDLKQAETYLKSAVAASPRHPHANNSLAYLYNKQGNTEMAIKCYENSLRGSFTVEAMHGLSKLKPGSAIRLIDLIRPRYKQPDYINFDKNPPPLQCTSYDQTEIRKAEHEYYNKLLDAQATKYERLWDKQKPIAEKSIRDWAANWQKKPLIGPFQPMAWYLCFSVQNEFKEKLPRLQKSLDSLERRRLGLKVEFDATMKQIDDSFEPRLDKIGEGNPDPTLDEEICNAHNACINAYLPQFAEINELRYSKIIHVYKDYLNDYLYWIRFASFTEEQYKVEYYDMMRTYFRILKQWRLTTLFGFCQADPPTKEKKELKFDSAQCPLPIGVELPFVVGKVQFNCDHWGLEIGEGIVFDIEHIMGGATTIAIGPGLSKGTPRIGGDAPMDINPGIEAGIKAQVFVTFDATTVSDWGILFEAEIDVKGLGKGAELKQNAVLGVNKGLTAEGPVTELLNKLLDIPPIVPEQQVNKNVPIYKPN